MAVVTITPAAAMLIQLAVEALIRRLTNEMQDMSEEEMDIRIAELQAMKNAAMAELEAH